MSGTFSDTLSDAGAANALFWNALCGSGMAQALGVRDASAPALARFDAWYFGFYPYLERHIPFSRLAGRPVLEVGLGYGSVSQRLAMAGVLYHGLDIAAAAVEMVRHRLRQNGLGGDVRQGSILDCPWPDAAFDHVVAIGCYHHTGDLPRAVAETRRVLRPGGAATIMVYSAYSYRRWLYWPATTARRLLVRRDNPEHATLNATAAERAAYDSGDGGEAAPLTEFLSASGLRRLLRDWSRVDIVRENIGSELFLKSLPRDWLLQVLGPLCGLDLYCHAVK